MAPDSATTVDAEDGDDALPPVHLNRDFRVLWLARTLGQTAANTAQFGSLIVIVEQTGSGFLSSVGGLARVGLVVFIVAVVALSLVDALEESLGAALNLTRIDLGFVEISPESQIVMIILLPMGFAFSLVNVAANAVLNARVPGGMQGRVFALQSVLAGVASVPPLLAGGGLTEILDVRIVLGLSPVVLVFAWMWSHWGTPDPVAAWRRRALQRSSP